MSPFENVTFGDRGDAGQRPGEGLPHVAAGRQLAKLFSI
jgi:hypothetical protein